MKKYMVSTPSRICLFGEHQDYLGLEVIACAINLRFSAQITRREDQKIIIRIRDSKIDTLGMENTNGEYETEVIDLEKPIVYENKRDYLKSSIKTLQKSGYELTGFDIQMDSEIPIGKGMCSSSTMIVVLIKAILEAIGSEDKDNAEKIAFLAFQAEVTEFQEPGGMMDHYASALGGLVNLDFSTGEAVPVRLNAKLEGCFILFDSKEQKNTTKVLADAKAPSVEATQQLQLGVKDFYQDEGLMVRLNELDEKHKKALRANIENYKILQEAKAMLKSGRMDEERFGWLLSAHHKNLRDGLGVSTPKIDAILNTAIEAGALGGKVNGSGGGGCCFVYCRKEKAQAIIEAVSSLGYPAQVLTQDTGVRLDRLEVYGS